MAQSPAAFHSMITRQADIVHAGHRATFFCNYTYDANRWIDLPGKAFISKANQRVVWMPIVPYARLGKHLGCWHSRCYDKGKVLKSRSCCTLHDPHFRAMESDLHNIVAMVPQVAKHRQDFDFEDIPLGLGDPIHECGLIVESDKQRVSPPPAQRGAIARAYLYMHDTYDIALSIAEQTRFQQWHLQYPPAHWEIAWDNAVAEMQGKHNFYIQSNVH